MAQLEEDVTLGPIMSRKEEWVTFGSGMAAPTLTGDIAGKRDRCYQLSFGGYGQKIVSLVL